jgi:lipoyl(octanoyl) transferase
MLEIAPHPTDFLASNAEPIDWIISKTPVPYKKAVEFMEGRVDAIIRGKACEAVWLLEHPPLYTAGTSAKSADLLNPTHLPVFKSGRGGQYTYHGPGQRIAYVMLDLKKRNPDLRAFVQALEDWLIATLRDFNIRSEKRCDRVGVWVKRDQVHDDKIAALGIRLRKWVSFHGVALNVAPDLSHYDSIIPCGVREHGITSLNDLGVKVPMEEVDKALRKNFELIFGQIRASTI